MELLSIVCTENEIIIKLLSCGVAVKEYTAKKLGKSIQKCVRWLFNKNAILFS